MNDIKLIMENWRRYSDTVDSLKEIESKYQTPNSDTIYLIKENKVEEASFSLLLEKHEKNKISTDKLANIIQESINYEHQQLLNEGLLDWLTKSWEEWKKEKAPEELGKIAKLQWRARQALFWLVYGAAGKAAAFARSVLSKITKYVTNHLKSLLPHTKKAPPPEVATKLLNANMKAAKFVGNLLKKVAQGLMKIVRPVIKFLANPVVKGAFLVICLTVVLVSAIAPSALVAAPAFLVPFATRRVAVKAVKKGVFGLEEELLQEELPVFMTEISEFTAETYAAVDADTIGEAMRMLAEEIGDATVDTRVVSSTAQFVEYTEEGEKFVDLTSESWHAVSNDEIKAQMRALKQLQKLGRLKEAGQMAEVSADLVEYEQITDNLVGSVLNKAANHCQADPAACSGAKKFIKEINVLGNSTIKSDTMAFRQSSREVIDGGDEIIKSSSFSSRDMDITTREYVSKKGGSFDPGVPDPEAMKPGEVPAAGHEYGEKSVTGRGVSQAKRAAVRATAAKKIGI